MYKYLEINNMQTYFHFLLVTLNVPLQIGKCTPGVHVPQVGNLCIRVKLSLFILIMILILKLRMQLVQCHNVTKDDTCFCKQS